MLIEKSTKNTGVHWNAIFHKLIGYINTVVRFIILPWMVLLFFIIAVLVYDLFTGEIGHNGGMTGFFQSMGLHPHTSYEAFLWITGIGVFFAIVSLLLSVVVALLEAAAGQMQKAGLKDWILQKTAPLRNAIAHFEAVHPNVVIALVTFPFIAGFVFLAMSPTPRNQMIVWPPVGSQIVQASPYSSVLLQVPNSPYQKAKNAIPTTMIPATHTISGKAVVTQTGPHTYQVRMIPCSFSTLS